MNQQLSIDLGEDWNQVRRGTAKPKRKGWKGLSSKELERRMSRNIYMREWNKNSPKYRAGTEKRRLNGRGRESTFIYMYGINYQQRDEILRAQSGGCAICGIELDYYLNDDGTVKLPANRRMGLDRAHVDHTHDKVRNTFKDGRKVWYGRVRGILCHRCNLVLGHARDNPAVLLKALTYLNERGQ